MSANNVTVGIRLTVDGREVQGSLRLTQAELERLGDTSQRAAGDVQNLGNNTTSLVDKLKSYKNEILAIAAAYGAYKIGDYVKEATLLAARYETLGIVLKYAGNNAGYSSLQVDEYAKKLNQSGISMIKARESVIAMAAAQLDLNKAQELGRVAQNLAVVSGQNSSETLESLITNIQQADTEGLRFLGITLDQSKALQEYSKQHRISVEVLTARQKAEAILNAVIQDSTKYTGIYEGAMSTAGKAMTSLSRYVEDLQVKLGIPFLDSFAKGIFGVTNVLKGANAEMNRLHQNKTLESLGQALGVLTGGAINGIVGAFNLLGETIRGVTRIVNENKLAFIALATGASAALLYQLVPALIAVGHTAWLSMLPPVVAAFAKVVSVARSAAIAIAFSFSAGITAGLSTIGATVASAIAAVPTLALASAVAAGVALGTVVATYFGGTIRKLTPDFVTSALESVFAKIDSWTDGGVSGVNPNTPEASGKVDPVKAAQEEAALLKAARERAAKEAKGQEALAASQMAQVDVATKDAELARLGAHNARQDLLNKQAYDNRIITQVDYLERKKNLDISELNSTLAKVQAEKHALALVTAIGDKRDPTADKSTLIGLLAQESVLRTKIATAANDYNSQIANARLDDLTSEFGATSALADSVNNLAKASRYEMEEAGKSKEQIEVLRASRLNYAATTAEASLAVRVASGQATAQEISNTNALVVSLRAAADARLMYSGANFMGTMISATENLAQQTRDITDSLTNSFRFNEEERVRIAASASLRVMEIRKQEQVQVLDQAALDAVAEGDFAKAQDIASRKQQILAEFSNYRVALEQNTAAQIEQSGYGLKNLSETMIDLFNPDKVTNFTSALANGLGQAGNALAGMADAYEKFAVQQKQNDAARVQALKQYTTGSMEQSTALTAITSKQSKEQSQYYANLAGSAKSFFGQNTAAYKVLQAVETAYRVASIAAEAQALAVKLGFKEVEVATTVGGAAAKGAAEAASTTASVANAGTQASAWGVTAVVKAIASLPFPLNLAAGAATLAAVVAVGAKVVGSLSGGGGPSVSQQRQEAAGKGSVLGDDNKVSESISNSIDLLASNSKLGLNHSAGMLLSLRNIESNIGGLAALLIRSNGLTGSAVPDSLGAAATIGNKVGSILNTLTLGVLGKLSKAIGNFVGKIANSIFGGNTTTLDTGLTANRLSVASVYEGGLRSNQYTDTKKDGGWFRSDKYSTNYSALGTQADDQFSKVIIGIAEALKAASGALGQNSNDFTSRLNGFVVDIGKVSLKGLTGEQIQKQLEATFSKLGDDMALTLLPGYQLFQKVGEGYLQTVARVASAVELAGDALNKLGVAAVDVTQVGNKQGDIAAEIVRQSLLVQESATGVGAMLKVFSGTAADLIDLYTTMLDLRASLKAAQLAGIDLTMTMITAAGGIDNLNTGLSAYQDKFFTDTEKSAAKTDALASQFQRLNVAMPTSYEGFRKLITGLDTTTEAGQRLFGQLIALAPAFADVSASVTQATANARAASRAAQESIDSAAGQYQNFVSNVDTKQGSLQSAAAAIQSKYTAAMQAQVQAQKSVQDQQKKLTDGYVSASQKVADLQSKIAENFQKLADTLRTFLDSLETGDLGGGTPVQKIGAMRQQFNELVSAAMNGDTEAGGRIPTSANQLLKAAQSSSASSTDYQRELAYVRNSVANVEKMARASGGVTQKGLQDQLAKALDEQGKWSEAVTKAGASFTSSAESILAGYNSAVAAQQEASSSVMFWSNVAGIAGTKLDKNADSLNAQGKTLLEAYFKAQSDLKTAQSELDAVNRVKGALELRQTTSLEQFVFAIKDVNEKGKLAQEAAAELYKVASDKLLEGSETAKSAMEEARAGMTYWGNVVSATAAGIAASAQAIASAAQQPQASYAESVVQGAYGSTLNRNADPGGLKFWVDKLKNGDLDLGTISKAIAVAGAAQLTGNNHPAGWTREAAVKDVTSSTAWLRAQGIPGYASGGMFGGGLRVVGENGPELEATGAARIWNAADTARMLRQGSSDSGGAMGEVVQELRDLRREVTILRQEQRQGDLANIRATKETTSLLRNVTDEGNAILTKAV